MERVEFVKFQVDMVVKLLDGFAASPVEESGVLFTVNGVPFQPVRKGGGYYVFCNLEQEKIILSIDCPSFQKTEKEIYLPALRQEENRQITIKLAPSVNYPLPTGAMRLYLTVKTNNGLPLEGVSVYVVPAQPRGRIKFTGWQEEHVARIYDPAKNIMQGTMYAAVEEDTETIQMVLVKKRLENNLYELSFEGEPLHPGALLQPVTEGISDGQGKVFIPLQKEGFVDTYYLIYQQGSVQINEKFFFAPNQTMQKELCLTEKDVSKGGDTIA